MTGRGRRGYTLRVRPRAVRHPLLIALSIATVVTASGASGAEPVPPVPGKQGTTGPREGFSTARLRLPKPGVPGDAARAPLATQEAFNILAIRVAFSDTPIESSAAYYNRLLFFQKQFWEQQTGGVAVLNATLWDSVFTLPRPMSYYGDDARFQERVVHLVRDAVLAADSTVDFRPYNSIVLFHAGGGQEADVLNNSQQQIWSAFVTKEDFKIVLPDTTGAGAIGIKTNDEISPGVFRYVQEAVELPETESQDGYVFGMTGVVCHEFGHQLGLPDLYDTNGDEGGNSQGLGAWDIMSTGVWNANGYVPAGAGAWCQYFLGALAPQRITSDGSASLSMLERQVGADPRAVQIPMTQSEYLLLENRRQDLNDNGKFDFDDTDQDGLFDFYTDSYAGAEYDYWLPGEGTGSGILIYHVDEAKIAAGLTDNVVNSDAAHKGIDLIEADGVEDLDGPPTSLSSGSPDDVFRAGWRDKLTPDTTPSTAAYGNAPTGISITGISAADSVMTFDVAFDRVLAGWPKQIAGRIRAAAPLAAYLGVVQVGTAGPALQLLVPVTRLNNTGALYVFNADGTDLLDGDATPTAFAVTAAGIPTSPCVGDIDGLAGYEIVFVTATGTVYAFHANGTEVLDGDANPLTLGVLVPGSVIGFRGQPILAELNGAPGLEIVYGNAAGPLGATSVNVVALSGGSVLRYSFPVGGSAEGAPVAADLDGDGLAEIIATGALGAGGENSAPGLSIANWETLNDALLPTDLESAPLYRVVTGDSFSPPVMSDLDRDGVNEVIVADASGAFHAYKFSIGPHIAGDAPAAYVTATELAGWPAATTAPGRAVEVSLGDLERDGYPEIFQTGEATRVSAFHWNGAPRSGYPLSPGLALSPADSTGFWAPLIADVDGDGIRDVIPILPDGRRPAYRADGSLIPGFMELGSTGSSAPPLLADLDGDGQAEWVEAYDAGTQFSIVVRRPPFPVATASVVWGQYRLNPTRNAVFPTGPLGGGPGTQVLSEVYAYPNPSHGGTSRIHYRLAAEATSVSIRIYDPVGALVAELPTGPAERAGSAEHAVVWDHASLASGIYLCRVEVQSSRGTEVRLSTLAVIR